MQLLFASTYSLVRVSDKVGRICCECGLVLLLIKMGLTETVRHFDETVVVFVIVCLDWTELRVEVHERL
jgi:hypothetical protein